MGRGGGGRQDLHRTNADTREKDEAQDIDKQGYVLNQIGDDR